jgi:hypothetical protein
MPKPASKFALTIPHFGEKEVVRLTLEHLPSPKYLISVEKHHELHKPLETSELHIHAFFELPPNTANDLPTVREILLQALQSLAGDDAPTGFDIQQCKRPPQWIKYCTKVKQLSKLYHLPYY